MRVSFQSRRRAGRSGVAPVGGAAKVPSSSRSLSGMGHHDRLLPPSGPLAAGTVLRSATTARVSPGRDRRRSAGVRARVVPALARRLQRSGRGRRVGAHRVRRPRPTKTASEVGGSVRARRLRLEIAIARHTEITGRRTDVCWWVAGVAVALEKRRPSQVRSGSGAVTSRFLSHDPNHSCGGDSPRDLAGTGDLLSELRQLLVAVLRQPGEHLEGHVGGHPAAGHHDPLRLSDDVA